MDYQNLVCDFARRTRCNLEALRECQSQGVEVYEVTQLINSMLGLLVLPKERYYDSIPKIPLDQLREEGWPESVLNCNIGSSKHLQELVCHLRHSIAHFNIKFTETGGKINGVVLTNKPNNHVRWKATLTLDDLKCLTDKFTDLILMQEENIPTAQN